MASRYETNIERQPELIREILDSPLPAWMAPLRKRPVHFVGVGSSHHAARIARAFWRRAVSPKAEAADSFDFVKLPRALSKEDVCVLLTHRAGRSYTVEAAKLAHEAGAVTIGMTGRGSHWTSHLTHHLETSDREDTGAFTKSVTTTLAWLAHWTGDEALRAELLGSRLEAGPNFPNVHRDTDIILLGDLEREWVARETALKLNEAAWLPARAFGLEEFMHGPRVSVSEKSLCVAFVNRNERRWDATLDFLKSVGVLTVEVEGPWLQQLFWGQRFTAAACRQLGLDPDLCRSDDPRFKGAT